MVGRIHGVDKPIFATAYTIFYITLVLPYIHLYCLYLGGNEPIQEQFVVNSNFMYNSYKFQQTKIELREVM